MTDLLTTCRRCDSDACYEIHSENHIRWQCLDCGFYTNTLMLKGSDMVKYIKDTSPDLIIDLLFEDLDGFIWCPAVINRPLKGVVFPNGGSIENWSWCFAPEIPIPEGQRHRFPIKGKPGEFHTHKVSLSDAKSFGQNDFILALQEAGFLNDI